MLFAFSSFCSASRLVVQSTSYGAALQSNTVLKTEPKYCYPRSFVGNRASSAHGYLPHRFHLVLSFYIAGAASIYGHPFHLFPAAKLGSYSCNIFLLFSDLLLCAVRVYMGSLCGTVFFSHFPSYQGGGHSRLIWFRSYWNPFEVLFVWQSHYFWRVWLGFGTCSSAGVLQWRSSPFPLV